MTRWAIAVMLAVVGPALPGQVGGQAGTTPLTGLLIVAHGADSGWNGRVRETVAQVHWDGPVAMAFLMGAEADSASWDAALQRLESEGIDRLVVVPLMVSSFGAHTRQIRHYAGEPVALPAALAGHLHGGARRPGIPTVVAGGLDDAPELGVILGDRWRGLGHAARRRSLFFVAHGPSAPEDVAPWRAGIASAIVPLRDLVGAERLGVGLMQDDAEPRVREAAVAAVRDSIRAMAMRDGDSVVVMTVLISTSDIDRVRFPADLSGLPMVYVGAVLAPHPALARWVERRAREASARFTPRPEAPSPPAPPSRR